MPRVEHACESPRSSQRSPGRAGAGSIPCGGDAGARDRVRRLAGSVPAPPSTAGRRAAATVPSMAARQGAVRAAAVERVGGLAAPSGVGEGTRWGLRKRDPRR